MTVAKSVSNKCVAINNILAMTEVSHWNSPNQRDRLLAEESSDKYEMIKKTTCLSSFNKQLMFDFTLLITILRHILCSVTSNATPSKFLVSHFIDLKNICGWEGRQSIIHYNNFCNKN